MPKFIDQEEDNWDNWRRIEVERKWYGYEDGMIYFLSILIIIITMRASINRFGQLSGLIKKVKRTGWLRYLPSYHVESVGDHSSKIAFLSLFLRGI